MYELDTINLHVNMYKSCAEEVLYVYNSINGRCIYTECIIVGIVTVKYR